MKKKLLAFAFVILTVSLVALSGCGNYGTFYSLTKAYEEGLITYEDLLSIAYYHNGGIEGNEELMGEDYEPIAKEPLDENTERKIRETRAYELRNSETYPDEDATADGVKIRGYLGKYSNCYVVKCHDPGTMYPSDRVDRWFEVSGVMFHKTAHGIYVLWKEN